MISWRAYLQFHEHCLHKSLKFTNNFFFSLLEFLLAHSVISYVIEWMTNKKPQIWSHSALDFCALLSLWNIKIAFTLRISFRNVLATLGNFVFFLLPHKIPMYTEAYFKLISYIANRVYSTFFCTYKRIFSFFLYSNQLTLTFYNSTAKISSPFQMNLKIWNSLMPNLIQTNSNHTKFDYYFFLRLVSITRAHLRMYWILIVLNWCAYHYSFRVYT